jgi:zinc transport system substrate-binding protein
MNKKILFLFFGLILAVALIIFIFRSTPTQTSNKLPVTASFYPLYFFASEIGGEKVNVINITPAGMEPHDYEPSARDLAQIENSKLLILNGLGLEAWGGNVKKNLNAKNTSLVVVGEGIKSGEIKEDEKKITDSHVWLNPSLAKLIADKILTGFIKVDPANANYYQTNVEALKSKLDELDKNYQTGLKNCAQKNIITAHAAFGYLATEYGLKQIAIAGLSPDAEPTPKDLINISQLAKENKIKYIFFESLTSPKLSETIANEVGAKTLVLNPIEGLTQAELSVGKNYFTIMQDNLVNLKTALQCQN